MVPNFYKGSHKNKATLFMLISGHILEICNSSVCKKHHCCSRGNSSSGAAEKMWPDVEIIIHCVGQKRAPSPPPPRTVWRRTSVRPLITQLLSGTNLKLWRTKAELSCFSRGSRGAGIQTKSCKCKKRFKWSCNDVLMWSASTREILFKHE